MLTRENLENMEINHVSSDGYKAVKDAWDGIAKPLDGMGKFEQIISQIGAIQGTTKVDIRRKMILTMCADNGIVAEGVSQSGQDVTTIVTEFMGRKQSSVGKMATTLGVDVIPVDVGINGDRELEGVRNCKVMHGTRDFLVEPAMTEPEVLQAIEVGFQLTKECKDNGYKLIGIGEMGIGNTTTSSAVAAILTGAPVELMTGRGAGLSDSGLERKRKVIAEALAKYPVENMEPLDVLATFGGLDIAAMAGVCIGGAYYGVPIVLDGVISMVAALVAERIKPGVREYLIPSHMSKEPAAKVLAKELNLCPVIQGELALGEGTGAVMLFALLDLAMAIYGEQTTFDNMEIGQYERFQGEKL